MGHSSDNGVAERGAADNGVEGCLLSDFGHEKKGETEISPFREPKSRQMRHATPSATFLCYFLLG